MTPGQFRHFALSMPEAFESAHMGHPDFRVEGKIFAILGHPNERSAVVMLTPEDQTEFLLAHPDAFRPATGAWGRQGSTSVQLEAVSPSVLREVVALAWRGRAPKRLVAQQDMGL